MNCKPGDLAIVLRSVADPKQIGKIIRCVERTGQFWIVEPPLDDRWWAVADRCLRPIRGTDPADVERAEDFAHA